MRSNGEQTIISHGVNGRQRSSPITMDVRTVAYFAVLVLIVGLAGGLYLYRQSQVDAYARQAYELYLRKQRLRREISNLRAEAARRGSLERIYRVGELRGYGLVKVGDTERHIEVPVSSVSEERSWSEKGLWSNLMAATPKKVRTRVRVWLEELLGR